MRADQRRAGDHGRHGLSAADPGGRAERRVGQRGRAVPDGRGRDHVAVPEREPGADRLQDRGHAAERVQPDADSPGRAVPAPDGRRAGVLLRGHQRDRPDPRGAIRVAMQPAGDIPEGRGAVRVRGHGAGHPGGAGGADLAAARLLVQRHAEHGGRREQPVRRVQPVQLRAAAGQGGGADAGVSGVREPELPVRPPDGPGVRPAGGDAAQRAGQVPRELHQEAVGPGGVRALRSHAGVPVPHAAAPADRAGRRVGVSGEPGAGRRPQLPVPGQLPRGAGPADGVGVLLGVRAVSAGTAGHIVAARARGRVPHILGAGVQGIRRVSGLRGRRDARGVHAVGARLEPALQQQRARGPAPLTDVSRAPVGQPDPAAVRGRVPDGQRRAGRRDQPLERGPVEREHTVLLVGGRCE